jgi:hypothetical protein
MRSLMRFIDEVPTPATRVPSYNLAFLPHFQTMSEEAFRRWPTPNRWRESCFLNVPQNRRNFSEHSFFKRGDQGRQPYHEGPGVVQEIRDGVNHSMSL